MKYLSEEDEQNVMEEFQGPPKNEPDARSSELLACPFCGGQAKIFTRDVHDTTPEPRRKFYWYVCNTYKCGVGVTHAEWTEEAARKKWNTRAKADETANEAMAQALVRSSELVGTLLETIDDLRHLIWDHHSDDILKAGIVVCPACTTEKADEALDKAELLLMRHYEKGQR